MSRVSTSGTAVGPGIMVGAHLEKKKSTKRNVQSLGSPLLLVDPSMEGDTPASKLAAPKVGRNAGVRSALRLGSWGVLGLWG